MEAILEPLVRSPKLRLYVDELNETLRREAEARVQFRASLDEDIRAEFINGEVVEHVPARHAHSIVTRYLGRLVSLYVETKSLGAVVTEQALTGFTRNDYGPDVCCWSAAKAAAIGRETTIYPVPDFVAEVLSPSTEARDRGVKFEDYAAHGVAEYWIIDPDARVIEQYFAANGNYELAGKLAEGVLKSRAIAGFEIPVNAVFDEAANHAAVRSLFT